MIFLRIFIYLFICLFKLRRLFVCLRLIRLETYASLCVSKTPCDCLWPFKTLGYWLLKVNEMEIRRKN